MTKHIRKKVGEIKFSLISPEKIKKLSTINIIKRDLDIGEAEAIALALELKADWILLDEREARKTAKREELTKIKQEEISLAEAIKKKAIKLQIKREG